MDYYNKQGVSCFEVLKRIMSPEELEGFCKGNIIKYLWREKDKGGTDDLLKARWYLEQLIFSRKKLLDTDGGGR